jgi:hypothetical protein
LFAESHFGPIPLTVDSLISATFHLSGREPIMVRSVPISFAVLLISTAASAENQANSSTDKEEQARHHDARRFCKDDIPDQFKVASCLQTNREKISRACKAVLESHGM